jgi:hypothetical protein
VTALGVGWANNASRQKRSDSGFGDLGPVQPKEFQIQQGGQILQSSIAVGCSTDVSRGLWGQTVSFSIGICLMAAGLVLAVRLLVGGHAIHARHLSLVSPANPIYICQDAAETTAGARVARRSSGLHHTSKPGSPCESSDTWRLPASARLAPPCRMNFLYETPHAVH